MNTSESPTRDRKLYLIDLCISTLICQYIDNEDDPYLNFGGSADNDFEFVPRILYDHHRGGIIPAIRRIIAQHELDTYSYNSIVNDVNENIIKGFKIVQYPTPICKSQSTNSTFVGTYTNSARINASVMCNFSDQIVHVTFAGTNGLLDLMTDIDAVLEPMDIPIYDNYGVRAHRGAMQQLTTNGFAYQLVYTVLSTIRSAVLLVGDDKPWSVSISGYSLGAIHAQLFILFMNDHILNRNGYSPGIESGTAVARTIDIRYCLHVQAPPVAGNKRFCQVLSRIINGTFDTLLYTGSTAKATDPLEVTSIVNFNTVRGEVVAVGSYNDPVLFAHNIAASALAIPLTFSISSTFLFARYDYIHFIEFLLSEPIESRPPLYLYMLSQLGDITQVGDIDVYNSYFVPSISYYLYLIPNIQKYHLDSYFENIFRIFEDATGIRPEDISII
jgi:hypothetical protein